MVLPIVLVSLAAFVALALAVTYAVVPAARTWIKANWKTVAKAIAVLFGAAVASGIYDAVAQAVRGKIPQGERNRWMLLDEHTVLAQVGTEWKAVPLPTGVEASRVVAVSMQPGKTPVVEVDNAPVDQT